MASVASLVQCAPWWQPDLSRAEAEALLKRGGTAAFVVRRSSQAGAFAVTTYRPDSSSSSGSGSSSSSSSASSTPGAKKPRATQHFLVAATTATHGGGSGDDEASMFEADLELGGERFAGLLDFVARCRKLRGCAPAGSSGAAAATTAASGSGSSSSSRGNSRGRSSSASSGSGGGGGGGSGSGRADPRHGDLRALRASVGRDQHQQEQQRGHRSDLRGSRGSRSPRYSDDDDDDDADDDRFDDDEMSVEERILSAPWWLGDLPRDLAEDLLRARKEPSFLVRNSSQAGHFAVSTYKPSTGKMNHALVAPAGRVSSSISPFEAPLTLNSKTYANLLEFVKRCPDLSAYAPVKPNVTPVRRGHPGAGSSSGSGGGRRSRGRGDDDDDFVIQEDQFGNKVRVNQRTGEAEYV